MVYAVLVMVVGCCIVYGAGGSGVRCGMVLVYFTVIDVLLVLL